MDGDLNRFKEVKDAAGFAGILEEIMTNELTHDFWTVTLPANLDSSSAPNPELFAYTAQSAMVREITVFPIFKDRKIQFSPPSPLKYALSLVLFGFGVNLLSLGRTNVVFLAHTERER